MLPFWALAQLTPIAVPLTDSISDNKNPDIVLLNSYQALMVWEKSNSPDSTAIFGKILHPSGLNDTSSFKVLGKAGVHFTHPVVMGLKNYSGTNQDTLAYLFYESNENGNKDLYYLKYNVNGNFFGPILFAGSSLDDKNLSLDLDLWGGRYGLSWQSGDKIMFAGAIYNNALHSYSFSQASVVDSGNVNRPVVNSQSDPLVLWEKQVNGETKIAWSSYFNSSLWSPVYIWNKPGTNSQISNIKGLDGMGMIGFVWKVSDGIQTHLFCQSFSLSYDSIELISNFHIEDPCATTAPMITKNSDWIETTFLVYNSDSLGNGEVFSRWMFSGNQNISNSTANDVHPKLFMLPGFGNWIYEIAISWESFRNGHWQIWYTYLDMSGGIHPVPADKFTVSFSPNPFHEDLKVDFDLKEDQDVSLKMFNSIGIKVVEISAIKGYMGGNSYFLHGIDDNGKLLPSGMYMIQLECRDGSRTTKVIKY